MGQLNNNKLLLISCLVLIILIFLSTNAISLSIAPPIFCYVEGEIVEVGYEEAVPSSDISLYAPERYVLEVDITSANRSEIFNLSNSNRTENCLDEFPEGEKASISIPDEEEIDEYELTAGNRINGTVKREQRGYFEDYDVEGDHSAPVDKPGPIIRWIKNVFESIVNWIWSSESY